MNNYKNKIQVAPDLYRTLSYNKKARFISYWHQIYEVCRLEPERCLEIGVGSGFVSNYLRKSGINITTIDIDRDLYPDITGDITNLPFRDSAFDVVACYEVLEHMPYSLFSKAISEIGRVTRNYLLLSLPDDERSFRFLFDLPVLGRISKTLTLPRIRKPVHQFDGQHFWEIGKHGYPLSKIVADIENAGFRVKSSYRVFENPRHRFMILKKELPK